MHVKGSTSFTIKPPTIGGGAIVIVFDVPVSLNIFCTKGIFLFIALLTFGLYVLSQPYNNC